MWNTCISLMLSVSSYTGINITHNNNTRRFGGSGRFGLSASGERHELSQRSTGLSTGSRPYINFKLLGDAAYKRFRLLIRQVVCSSVSVSVCLSVSLRYRDHRGWNSSKVFSWLVILRCSLSAHPNSRIYSKGNTQKFWPKVTHPLLIWASQTFDGKLRLNSQSEIGQWSQLGRRGRIGNHHRFFQWYDRWPLTTSDIIVTKTKTKIIQFR